MTSPTESSARIDHVETAIVGAGQSGLTVSRMLISAGREHIILERGRIGESWRSQRWDSFVLNTPDRMSSLFEGPALGSGGSAFSTHYAFVEHLEDYANTNALPVQTETVVETVEPSLEGEGFSLRTSRGVVRARNVVAASGGFSEPQMPGAITGASPRTLSIHAADYRNANSLPDGAVLVVGAAQTGAQIAEDLLDAGRQVFLSTSKVGRIRRHYRGRDTLEWWRDMGIMDERRADLADPSVVALAQHLVSGTRDGHTISLQQLSRGGVTLLGRLAGMDGDVAHFDDNLAENIAFGDEMWRRHRQRIDDYIANSGEPIPTDDPEACEAPLASVPACPRTLDLRREGISSIIAATGFLPSRQWLSPFGVLAPGEPVWECGLEPSPGLFVLGIPWLTHRASGIIYGAPTDATEIVRRIQARCE